ncbi:efflux RND transporter periplasmic adaptor subunit [Bacillus sp. BRMEA1]|uniref:efflux RND transporter periplasmic adaptor subunit n=1 Tax=Neobacillus endophyticus TaxID=2738405 RepID=UPI0015666F5B|nr:efflux RND transporter periplasmic adaptor subunit [Neobacillus endophyticus]NRD78618.1 efflux RND transporter periplasmic adaptor subunit [Neobacillus endophyticus]
MNKKTWIALGVVCLVASMIFVGVYRQAIAKGPAVKTVKMAEEEISSLLLVPGTVKLQEEQFVYPTPDKGEVKELLVKEGQTVKKGTILLRLKNNQLELETEQNTLAIETANLKLEQISQKISDLNDKEKTLAKTAGEEEAKKQLKPDYEQLDMDKKLADLDIKQAMLQKNMIQKRQSELEIKSTIDGIVLSAELPSASTATGAVSEPIIHIGKLEGMTAIGLLSEYDTLKVKKGQKVNLRSDAVPDQEWNGVVIDIGYLPQQSQQGQENNSQAVQYPVTVKISGDTKAIKPGFQVTMEVETDKKRAMVLPNTAIHDDGDQPYVFLVKSGKVHKQQVKTGTESGKKIEILSGVTMEDHVIANSSDDMKDGMDVTVK